GQDGDGLGLSSAPLGELVQHTSLGKPRPSTLAGTPVHHPEEAVYEWIRTLELVGRDECSRRISIRTPRSISRLWRRSSGIWRAVSCGREIASRRSDKWRVSWW